MQIKEMVRHISILRSNSNSWTTAAAYLGNDVGQRKVDREISKYILKIRLRGRLVKKSKSKGGKN